MNNSAGRTLPAIEIQKEFARHVLRAINDQLDDIKEFQVVSVPGESFRVNIDYHKAKPWEGKVDYE